MRLEGRHWKSCGWPFGSAWLGFSLPSAVALSLFAYGVEGCSLANAPWVHGLQVVAVAVVAQAVWGMARQFCTDNLRISLAILTTIGILFVPSSPSSRRTLCA